MDRVLVTVGGRAVTPGGLAAFASAFVFAAFLLGVVTCIGRRLRRKLREQGHLEHSLGVSLPGLPGSSSRRHHMLSDDDNVNGLELPQNQPDAGLWQISSRP
uniref:Uncharacterized protein n=1 Tax=Fibrocapsa japonica TaxID=94617 RepID=A0A7S2V4R7_9STRA|mmetsp:Transcript_4248/g.6353  ORF Transcript_4248/g.6353 Transcript_4248/m.6353 type:complete len:102 (+) Transcript_4248:3-308(+)